MERARPPFRADHVGSLLRPAALSEARAKRARGEITTAEGHVVGLHGGLHRYTVGQRRGLGISSPEPLYVVKIDVPRHQLVVGKRDELYKTSFTASAVNWIAIVPPAEPVEWPAEGGVRAFTAATNASPARTARSASSSCASG